MYSSHTLFLLSTFCSTYPPLVPSETSIVYLSPSTSACRDEPQNPFLPQEDYPEPGEWYLTQALELLANKIAGMPSTSSVSKGILTYVIPLLTVVTRSLLTCNLHVILDSLKSDKILKQLWFILRLPSKKILHFFA